MATTQPGLPGDFPMSLYRGDTYEWRFTLWVNSQKTDPLDLTDVAVKAQMLDKAKNAVPVDLVCYVTLPNVVEVCVEAPTWAALGNATRATWDMRLVYPDDVIMTIVSGYVVITPNVTVLG